MPGAYAHLALANDAQKRVEAAGLRDETAASLGLFLKYVELGAVGPDYPYLTSGRGQKKWADHMHGLRTATLLRAGVAAVAALPPDLQPKATAWLLGFAAHMTADMTIHPVVELRVGPYQGNEGEHRRCEMHQDAFIFPRVLDVGDTGLSEHLATGIASCHAPGNPGEIDPLVDQLWLAMLAAAYPNDEERDVPDPSAWHRGFRDVLATVTGINHLFPFARHVAADLNITYPAADDLDDSFIVQLRTPEGRMDYLPIYERARANILAVWKGLDDALRDGRSDDLDRLEDWNLDTGRSQLTGRLVFWREAA